MRVKMGWSGEIEADRWQKLDVGLEQEDLVRLLVENDIPAQLVDRLPTRVLFQLLQNEAEILLLNKLKAMGYPADQANARTGILLGQNQEIVTAIRNQLAAA